MQFLSIFSKSPMGQRFHSHPAGPIISNIGGWLFTFYWLPHCFMPFSLLKFDRYMPVYRTTWFSLYVFFLGWYLVKAPVKAFLLSGAEKKKDK